MPDPVEVAREMLRTGRSDVALLALRLLARTDRLVLIERPEDLGSAAKLLKGGAVAVVAHPRLFAELLGEEEGAAARVLRLAQSPELAGLEEVQQAVAILRNTVEKRVEEAAAKAALLAQVCLLVEVEASLRGVDAQPLLRRLYSAAAEHVKRAGLREQAEELEKRARSYRPPRTPLEEAAVERAAEMLAAAAALGGPQPEKVAEALETLAAAQGGRA